MTVSDVLRAAAERVTPDAWCQGHSFENEYGEVMPIKDGAARCCAVGHLSVAAAGDIDLYFDAVAAMRDYLAREVTDFNDEPGRTAIDVRTAMLGVAELLDREAVSA